jgi:hypothetical protein
MLKDTVYKVTGTAIAAIVAGAITLIAPKEIAAIVDAAVAGLAVWKYVAVKEIRRIADQAQAGLAAAQAAASKLEGK